MIDLSDLSLVVPFRFDHQDRIDNLRTVLDFYEKYFLNYEFIIYENGPDQMGSEFLRRKNVSYSFEYNSGLLHRTKMLNDGAKQSKRKFVSLYDTDVLFYPESIQKTMEALRTGHDFVFPYNGIFIDVSGPDKEKIKRDLEITIPIMETTKLYKKWGNNLHVIHDRAVGGATFFRKEVFLCLGGYNQNFVSWGYEDNEIVHRFNMMGVTPQRLKKSNLYHLSHFRGKDSQDNLPHVRKNSRELNRVRSMDRAQLMAYIANDLRIKLGI